MNDSLEHLPTNEHATGDMTTYRISFTLKVKAPTREHAIDAALMRLAFGPVEELSPEVTAMTPNLYRKNDPSVDIERAGRCVRKFKRNGRDGHWARLTVGEYERFCQTLDPILHELFFLEIWFIEDRGFYWLKHNQNPRFKLLIDQFTR